MTDICDKQLQYTSTCCTCKLVTVGLFRFRAPAISFLSEIASAGPFKHWELEDSEPQLKVDLEVYARSLDARESHCYHYITTASVKVVG